MKRKLALALTGVAALTLLVRLDSWRPQGALGVEATLAKPFFEGFGPFTPHRHPERHQPGERPVPGFRLAEPGSEVRIPGLLGGARVELVATIASALPTAQQVAVWANGVVQQQESVGGNYGLVHFSATVPASGELRLHFTSPQSSGAACRLGGIEIIRSSGGKVPPGRLVSYAALLLLAAGAAAWMRPGGGWPAAGMVLVTGVTVMGLLEARLLALGHLTHALTAGAAACLFALGCEHLLRLPRWAAGGLALGFGLKVLLATHPAFPSIDVTFHAHNIQRFQSNGIISSGAPGLQAVPYPPAFYAIVAPLVRGDEESDVRLLRLIIGILEGTSPLLVFALMRAAGASREASGAGAVASALMPEGMLVLAKGIACNIFGSFASLALLIGLVRSVSAATATALLALVLLSHAPVAFTVTLLLLLWWGLEYGRGTLDREALKAHLLSLAIAATVAWVVYYREVALVLATPGVSATDPGFWYVRWYRLGKILQDLLFKFGLIPLLWAIWGLTRADVPAALKGLLIPWFLVGSSLAVLAVGSPFPLRFEYFLTPAVAMAAGLGVERMRREGSTAWIQAGWAFTALVQALLGILLLFQRFEIISVIMESPRWPFPVRF